MLSEKQVIANRNNALKSTGPRSFEGKRIVARNAVRHGLLSSPDLTVIKGEDRTEFAEFSSNLLAELKPVGQLETLLAERITSFFWRLKRTGRMEKELLDLLTVPAPADSFASKKDLPFTMIIHKSYDNALQDSEYQDFLKFKKAQAQYANMEVEDGEVLGRETFCKYKNQFELPSPSSAPAAAPQVVEPEALGKAVKQDFKSEKLLDKLLRYEGQIERSLYRAMLELNKLQYIRIRCESITADSDEASSRVGYAHADESGPNSSPPFQGGVSRSDEGVLVQENSASDSSLPASDHSCSLSAESSLPENPVKNLCQSAESVVASPSSDSGNGEKPNKPILGEDSSGGTFKPQACGCTVSVIPNEHEKSIDSEKTSLSDSCSLSSVVCSTEKPNKPILGIG